MVCKYREQSVQSVKSVNGAQSGCWFSCLWCVRVYTHLCVDVLLFLFYPVKVTLKAEEIHLLSDWITNSLSDFFNLHNPFVCY